jgi:small-conductance mechanosensitive channel/CRP-like cAMP-binding protein
MPFESHLSDALLFAGMALALVLAALAVRSPPRRAMLVMLIVVAVGVLGLWAYERQGIAIRTMTGSLIAREIGLAVVAFGVIQIIVLFAFQTLLARRRIPRILTEFVVALSLIGYAIYRLNAVGVNLASVITTSAILGALAFSAQETLTNVWGGIAIQLEKSCRIGDWVRIEGVTGQVVSIRWRYMAIATITNETILIPNSTLMKNRITVVARRGEERTPWKRLVAFDVEFGYPPAHVIEHVSAALAHAQIPFIVPGTQPDVACIGFKETGIEYQVAYDLADAGNYWLADSQILVHVYAALMRQGIGIPFPRRIIEVRGDERPGIALRESHHRLAVLGAMDLFSSLTDEERARLARQLSTLVYIRDEIIFRAGEPADSLYLLAQGHVDVIGEDPKGGQVKLATLDAPTYFGEMGLLLGQPRAATVVAAGEAICHRIDKRGFDAIIRARPELAEMLAKVLAERQAANDATLQALDVEMRTQRHVSRTKELVRKIQQFFGL